MTRQHFELIARVLREAPVDIVGWHILVQRFADELAAENPRFDRERFLRACGVKLPS